MTMPVTYRANGSDEKRSSDSPTHKGHKPERTEPPHHEGHERPAAHPEGKPNGHPEHHRPAKPTSD